MAVEIEALELSISHESKGATNSIGKLVSALTHLRQAASGGAGLNQVVSQLRQLQQALNSSGASGASQALANTQRSATSAAVAVQQASRQVTELSSEFSSVQASASSAASATSNVASTAKGASAAAKDLTKETTNMGKAAKNSSNFFSKLTQSIGRIIFYRMIRSALRAVTQALKEGITNLYYYSQAVNNTDPSHAASTLDAYATAILKVKNSVAAAFMPIITAALPLIQSFTNAIIKALNVFNKFVSALTGQDRYLVASDNTSATLKNIETSAGGASGAVKDLKRQLMGFDELNILEEPSSGGGGGGGGSSGIDYNDMFDPVPIEPEFLKKIQGWLEPITSAIENIKTAWDNFANSELGQAVIDAFEFLGNLALSEGIERVGDAINYVADAIELITMLFDPEQFSLSKFLGLSGDMLETVGESASLTTYLGFSFANKLLGNLFGKEDGLIPDEWVRRLAEIITPGGGLGIIGELLEWLGIQFEQGEDSWLYQQSDVIQLGDETGAGKNGGRISGRSKGSLIITPTGTFYYNPFYGGSYEPDKRPQINEDFNFWEWLGFGNGNDDDLSRGENPIAEWYNKNVAPWFTKEKWSSFGVNATSWFKGTFVWEGITSVSSWYTNKVKPLFTKERWNNLGTASKNWFKQTFNWNGTTAVGNWYRDKVKPFFKAETWQNLGTSALNWFKQTFRFINFDAIGQWYRDRVKPWFSWETWKKLGQDAINALIEGIRSIHIPTFHLEWNSISWLNGTKMEWLKVPRLSFYAQGGYGIPNGQLFMANEAGPELVGQMNGKNTVANQGQIVEGIRQGVYDAVVSAFANNGGQNNHITVKVGDGTLADVVTRALNNQTRRLGYSQLEGI